LLQHGKSCACSWVRFLTWSVLGLGEGKEGLISSNLGVYRHL
jgi:hypothetical protein